MRMHFQLQSFNKIGLSLANKPPAFNAIQLALTQPRAVFSRKGLLVNLATGLSNPITLKSQCHSNRTLIYARLAIKQRPMNGAPAPMPQHKLIANPATTPILKPQKLPQ
jgi:hypothetical protein